MKRTILFLVFVILVSSCAPGPVGTWNYSVTGTPQGDYTGVMTVRKAEKGYAASLNSQGTDNRFNKFVYNKKSKKAEGDFDFSGTNILFEAQMNKDQMNGTMSAEGSGFPFKATRKK